MDDIMWSSPYDLSRTGSVGQRHVNGSRILLILTEFPPSFGGMQTHAVHLCRYLHRQGYRIEVATYRGPAVDFPFPVHRCLSRIGFVENLAILKSIMRVMRPDILYASTIFYGRLSESTGVPMIARSVGNDVLRPWIVWPYRCFSRMLTTPWLEDLLYRRFRQLDYPEMIESLLLARRQAEVAESTRHISHILANSGYTARLLSQYSVARVSVVPGGVDASWFHPLRDTRHELGLPKDKRLILTACRLVPKKGIDLLMLAVSKLPDTHLIVAGDGRQLLKSVTLANQLGIAGRVTFAGRIPHEDLPRYYWAADQFVLASREDIDARTGLRDVETMGRVLCEAHAAGVPVIASRSGGIPSIVENGRNGLLFEEGNLDSLIHSMERLGRDRELGRSLVNEGFRDAIQRWDWSVICRAHEETFRTVQAGSTVPHMEKKEIATAGMHVEW